MSTPRKRPAAAVLAGVVAGLLCGACEQADDEPGGGDRPNNGTEAPADALVFPEELRVEDEAVNDFVARAMRACGDGDYDAFRLLWSVQEEPLPRDEYEQGWQAVREIRIRALEKVRLGSDARDSVGGDRTVYVVLAAVALDPTHPAARKEPQREVVLMLAREHDKWCLARAPKRMRAWITKKIEAAPTSEPAATGQLPSPAGTGG